MLWAIEGNESVYWEMAVPVIEPKTRTVCSHGTLHHLPLLVKERCSTLWRMRASICYSHLWEPSHEELRVRPASSASTLPGDVDCIARRMLHYVIADIVIIMLETHLMHRCIHEVLCVDFDRFQLCIDSNMSTLLQYTHFRE